MRGRTAHTEKRSIANFRGFAMTPMNVFITEGNVNIYAFEVEARDQPLRLLCA